MSQQLNAYLPESLLTEKKQEHARRVCREDCLIINPADRFRILVAHGRPWAVGKRLDEIYLVSSSEMRFLRDTLSQNDRALLMGRDGHALLVFGDLLRSTGVLVVLSPHAKADAVARILRHTGRTDFAYSPSYDGLSLVPHAEDDALFEQLNEQFFYLDRILAPAHRIGLRTRTHLIANFVGCVLDDVAVPLDSLDCSVSEQNRLVAFLLCAFLSLRAYDGSVSARAETTSSLPLLRYRVEAVAHDGRRAPSVELPFLSLPSLRDFTVLSSHDGGATLEATLRLADGVGSVCTGAMHLIRLRFVAV